MAAVSAVSATAHVSTRCLVKLYWPFKGFNCLYLTVVCYSSLTNFDIHRRFWKMILEKKRVSYMIHQVKNHTVPQASTNLFKINSLYSSSKNPHTLHYRHKKFTVQQCKYRQFDISAPFAK